MGVMASWFGGDAGLGDKMAHALQSYATHESGFKTRFGTRFGSRFGPGIVYLCLAVVRALAFALALVSG